MKILIIICYLVSHIQILASVKIVTVDLANLFETDSVVAASLEKLNTQYAALEAENTVLLEKIRATHARVEALSKLLDNPLLGEKEKRSMLSERQLVIQSMPKNAYGDRRSLKKKKKAIEDELAFAKRHQMSLIYDKLQKMAEANDVDFLLDKSLRDESGRLVLVYSAAMLDVTKYFKGGKKNSKVQLVAVDKLKMATINSDLLLKKMKPDEIIKFVSIYAEKNGIHLVFDSSAESAFYSSFISSSAGSLDITDKIEISD